jgi:hypothetical protein
LSVPIEINYLDPQKPRGLVGPRPTIKKNTAFRVFSKDGPLKFHFKGDAPFADNPGDLEGDTDHVVTKPGIYKFKCKLHTAAGDVELDPDSPSETGGEMEVIP